MLITFEKCPVCRKIELRKESYMIPIIKTKEILLISKCYNFDCDCFWYAYESLEKFKKQKISIA